MQTHENNSHDREEFMRLLTEKANRMMQEKQSTITAGKSDEQPLAEWKCHANGMWVRHMPDDEHGVLRISVGGGKHLPVTLNYCTIRGTVGQCIDMLEMAIVALRECPE